MLTWDHILKKRIMLSLVWIVGVIVFTGMAIALF